MSRVSLPACMSLGTVNKSRHSVAKVIGICGKTEEILLRCCGFSGHNDNGNDTIHVCLFSVCAAAIESIRPFGAMSCFSGSQCKSISLLGARAEHEPPRHSHRQYICSRCNGAIALRALTPLVVIVVHSVAHHVSCSCPSVWADQHRLKQ